MQLKDNKSAPRSLIPFLQQSLNKGLKGECRAIALHRAQFLQQCAKLEKDSHNQETEMTEIAEKLKIALSQLSSQERAELAHFLIHSLDEEADDDIESAWDDELMRRLQDIESGTASGKPSSQVFAELREKYS